VGAELTHRRGLIGSPDTGGHVRARQSRELHREVADAAGGAGHEDALGE
jgi:hypothetical protein